MKGRSVVSLLHCFAVHCNCAHKERWALSMNIFLRDVSDTTSTNEYICLYVQMHPPDK